MDFIIFSFQYIESVSNDELLKEYNWRNRRKNSLSNIQKVDQRSLIWWFQTILQQFSFVFSLLMNY